MLDYKKDAVKIESLIEKCLKGTDLSCRTAAQAYPGGGEKEYWIYSLYATKRQIGSVVCFPVNHKVEVNAFPYAILTFGEDYRKQLEDDLQTLVRVEFEGTTTLGE